jgi:hypothetical protein
MHNINKNNVLRFANFNALCEIATELEIIRTLVENSSRVQNTNLGGKIYRGVRDDLYLAA